MQVQSLFQLFSPAIFALFAVSFFLIGRMNPEMRSQKLFAVSYIVGAAAFLTDFLRELMPVLAASVVSNLLYASCTLTFSLALCLRANARVPTRLLVVFSGFLVISFCYFTFVSDDIWARTLCMHFGNGAIFATAALSTRKLMTQKAERWINLAVTFTALQFFVRPVLVAWFVGVPGTLAEYKASTLFLTFHLATGFLAIVTAALLIAGDVFKVIASLTEEACTDNLTGLLNRRGFRASAARLLKHPEAEPLPVFVILCDLDKFKDVNDTYGHTFGDHVIRKMADLFNERDETRAIGARFGGEEFVLLLRTRSLEMAVSHAETIRKAFASISMKTPKGRDSFTASFGVAEHKPGTRVQDAIETADEALYMAKMSGRNRVVSEYDLEIGKIRKLSPAYRRNIPQTQQGAA